MYQDSLKRLYMEDYCKGIESFINFILSNSKNISVVKIRCSYVKCKNKNFHQIDVVIIDF